MSINIGEVIAVKGTQVTLRIFEDSSLETIFYEGKKYKGVSIREYIGIKRGFCLIVCFVEGEYLDENRFDEEDGTKKYIRKVEVKPVGYFEADQFFDGIKIMPMIKDSAFLLNEKQVVQVFSQGVDDTFVIGKMLKEDIPVSLPWNNLFNSHIGVFGNTGSGKSNTLTKLYTTLFNLYSESILDKSQFLLIDFNGEYTGSQLIPDLTKKKVFKLSTRSRDGVDKIALSEEQIWNTEVLALLFQATANTQTPFLNRVVTGRERFKEYEDSLKNYITSTFRQCFVTTSQHRDSLAHLKVIANHIGSEDLIQKLGKIFWYGNGEKFASKNSMSSWEYYDEDGTYDSNLGGLVEEIDVTEIEPFDELIIRINLQLLRDLNQNFVQYDHIQPLLKRVESSIKDFSKLFSVSADFTDSLKMLNVISLRDCNQVTRKIVPLLLAKMFYQHHRSVVATPPDKTLHLIIDEAHNILSQQSNREHESWKDYRLELFEEIIKEGRKFGIFLTLASQRPADISPTIMSQLHNFFIHRLVNDKDLQLIDNTISTLDRFSKSLIPNLSKGCCVITGTAFDIPVVMHVDYIEHKEGRPHSDDVDLRTLWNLFVDGAVQNE